MDTTKLTHGAATTVVKEVKVVKEERDTMDTKYVKLCVTSMVERI